MQREEQERLERQVSLDAERSAEERNRLGQFATPPELALQIARIALDYLGRGKIDFLEPSIGSGAFFSALISTAKDRVASARGVEIDPRFAAAARELWAKSKLEVLEGDFTKIQPDGRGSNLVLANPPYVRHHHLDAVMKVTLKEQAEAFLGCKVSGLAGLYVHFMLLADQWMRDGAVAAWLIPTEWMDVNYGVALKEYLCRRVTLLRVHCFDAADVQFGDALVSSAVVVFQKKRPAEGTECQLTRGSLTAPKQVVQVSVAELRDDPKWRGHFIEGGIPSSRCPAARTTLGDLFDVKRGVVTGGNDFFVRPRAEFLAMGIPDKFLRPVIPSSRYLDGDVIERARDGYPKIETPLALLDCDLAEQEVERSYPKLWEYLESEHGQEVRTGYLTSRRRPWYSQERRAHAPVITTYMGRGSKGGKPFRFFWNKSDAIATNVYLLLIPKPHVADRLRKHPELGREVVDFLSDTGLEELLAHGRVYGGGLYKLEPKELGRLNAEQLAVRLGVTTPSRTEQLGLAFGT